MKRKMRLESSKELDLTQQKVFALLDIDFKYILLVWVRKCRQTPQRTLAQNSSDFHRSAG